MQIQRNCWLGRSEDWWKPASIGLVAATIIAIASRWKHTTLFEGLSTTALTFGVTFVGTGLTLGKRPEHRAPPLEPEPEPLPPPRAAQPGELGYRATEEEIAAALDETLQSLGDAPTPPPESWPGLANPPIAPGSLKEHLQQLQSEIPDAAIDAFLANPCDATATLVGRHLYWGGDYDDSYTLTVGDRTWILSGYDSIVETFTADEIWRADRTLGCWKSDQAPEIDDVVSIWVEGNDTFYCSQAEATALLQALAWPDDRHLSGPCRLKINKTGLLIGNGLPTTLGPYGISTKIPVASVDE